MPSLAGGNPHWPPQPGMERESRSHYDKVEGGFPPAWLQAPLTGLWARMGVICEAALQLKGGELSTNKSKARECECV